jgi:3-hydroxyacyl-[acyl-carrier-protein] dehydratase
MSGHASPEVLASIPHRPPFLFVDAILAETDTTLTTTRTLRPDEDFYKGHYPGAPITPGVLLCEAVFQTGALFLSRRLSKTGGKLEGVPLMAKISDVRFRNPVYPGETITIQVTLKEVVSGFNMLHGLVTSNGKKVLNVDFAVTWKSPEGSAEAARQQQQQQQ